MKFETGSLKVIQCAWPAKMQLRYLGTRSMRSSPDAARDANGRFAATHSSGTLRIANRRYRLPILIARSELQVDHGPPGRQIILNESLAAAAANNGDAKLFTAWTISINPSGACDNRERRIKAIHCLDFSSANAFCKPAEGIQLRRHAARMSPVLL